MQIIIFGMHRSGTSCVSRLVNMMGGYFSPEGEEMLPQAENPKGFWERFDVMEVNNEILRASGGVWDQVSKINFGKIESKQQEVFKKKIQNIIYSLDGHRPWFVKDPRMCLVFSYWRPFLELPVAIFVYRNPLQIAQSLAQRNNFPLYVGIALWEYYVISAIKDLQGINTFVTCYEDLVESPVSEVKRIYNRLNDFGVKGLRLPVDKEIKAFVDPQLCHHRATQKMLSSYLNSNQLQLVNLIKNDLKDLGSYKCKVSESSIEILDQFFISHRMSLEKKELVERVGLNGKVLAQLNTEFSDVKDEHSRLANKLKESEKEYELLKKEWKTEEKDRTKAEKKLESLLCKYQEQREEFSHLKGLRDALEKRLDEVKLSRDDLQGKCEALEKDKEALHKELSAAYIGSKGWEVELRAEREDRAKVEKKLESLLNKYQEQREEFSHLKGLRDALEKRLDEVKLSRDDFQRKYETLDKEKESLYKKLADNSSSCQDMESALQKVHIKLKDERESKKNIEDFFREEEKKKYVLVSVCDLLDCQLKILQSEFDREKEKVAQYDSWMRELNRDIQDIFSSLRWKVGHNIALAFEICFMRFNKKIAKHHIEEILREYDSFLLSNNQSIHESKSKDEPVDESKDNHSPWDSFCRLTLAALKNPSQTARLLDPERLRNLYITLFKQSPHIRENIFNYYLEMYGENACKTIENVFPETGQIILDNNLCKLPVFTNPLVSIIIPVFNQWEFTEKCIASVAHSARGIEYELILADDCSTDETIHAHEKFTNLRVVKTSKNYGFLKNCNNAALHAKGDYLVFLNNDTVVHENWLQAMLETMETDPVIGLTGSKLVYPDGKLQEAGGIIWQDGSGWNFGRLDDPEKPEYNYVKEVDYISGASIMVRSSLWNEIGGFDERYVPAYCEDSDLAFEVRARGYKVIYTPFSLVTHFEGQSHGTDDTSEGKKHQIVNNEKFYRKWSQVLDREQFPNGEKVFYARDRSRHKKTLLMVDHYVPHYDKDAGSKTIMQYLQFFVEEGFSVKFIGDNFYKHEPYTSHLEEMGIEVLYGPWYADNWRKWCMENADYINYIFLNRPHISDKYIDFFNNKLKAKVVYYGHDLHFLREHRRYLREGRPEILDAVEKWKAMELAICSKVDMVLYPSIVEIAELKKEIPDINAVAIPAYLYPPSKNERLEYSQTKDLMFVGGFGHPPNIDAVEWFLAEVFPLVLTSLPDVKFFIIGSNPPDSFKEYETESVIISGYMPEEKLREYYQSIRIAVAPLQYGAGVKGKVVEAIYNRIPMVTTSVGAEGLPEAETILWVEDDPNLFAEKIIAIYRNDEQISNYCEKAEKYIAKYFSRNSAKTVLRNIFYFSGNL